MVTIKFIQSKADTIYVYFYVNRKKVFFSTRISCEKSCWDEEKMCVKRSDKDYANKNLMIENIRSRIVNVFVKYKLKDRKLTKELFMKQYNRPDDYDTFHEFCLAMLKTTSKNIELNTYRSHKGVLNKLLAFNPKLHFDDITSEFLISFKRYLIKEYGNNNNTACKNLSVIRKYVRMAIKEGYMEEYPFENMHISRSASNVIFLDDKELKTLCKFYERGNYDTDKYRKTLQLFLYMCFGSQHIGDALSMKIEQFGEKSYVYYRKKNRNSKPEPVEVPISRSLRIMIDEIAEGRTKGKLFVNMPEEQTMNEYLKFIAAEAGIFKNISHKTGRHTFATIYLQNNPNIRNLQSILGHSDSKTTMMYVHAMEKYKSAGVDCFNSFLK